MSIGKNLVSIGIKYFSVIFSLSSLFVMFVACGADMYKVQMKDDITVNSTNQDHLDPQSDRYGIHAISGWRALPIQIKFDKNLDSDQRKEIQKAIQTWHTATGKQLFETVDRQPDQHGDELPDLYSSLQDFRNTNYGVQNTWDKLGKSIYTMATTVWQSADPYGNSIETADIKYNQQYYLFGDAYKVQSTDDRYVSDLETTALHELGHLLGLTHADEDPFSIMVSSMFVGEGIKSPYLSRGDIERIQKIYGCDGAACNIDALVEKFNYERNEDENQESSES